MIIQLMMVNGLLYATFSRPAPSTTCDCGKHASCPSCDHDYIKKKRQKREDLFPKILNTRTADEQEMLFARIKTMIVKHIASEEKEFYKKLGRKNKMLGNTVVKAQYGHKEIRRYLARLGENLSYEEWIFTLGELKHSIIAHIEVKKAMLKLAAKAFKNYEFANFIGRMEASQTKISGELPEMWENIVPNNA